MRILTLLILCLSLAFAGVSYAHSFDSSCPMEQGEDMAAMGHAAMADCCNDAETAAKTGKPCKTDQSCSVSPLVMIFSAPTWHFVATDRNAAFNTTPSVPTLSPTDLWRPPTLS